MNRSGGSSYDLSEVKRAMREGRYRITYSALRGCEHMGFSPAMIVDAVLGLRAADFDKTMPAKKVPGLWQDVYRRTHANTPLYVKVQIAKDGTAVVISFKQGR